MMGNIKVRYALHFTVPRTVKPARVKDAVHSPEIAEA
jgi:hypothetical protein